MKEEEVALVGSNEESGLLKQYFEMVREYERCGEKFPVDFELVWPLVYKTRSWALKSLKKRFKGEVDYEAVKPLEMEVMDKVSITSKTNELQNDSPEVVDNKGSRRVGFGGDQRTENYKLSVNCLEFFIARKSREVFNVYREVFRAAAEAVEKKSVSEKRLLMYKKQGRSMAWIDIRMLGIEYRKALLEAIKNHEGNRYGAQKATDAVYVEVFEKPAKEIREERGLEKRDATRDSLSITELALVAISETLAIDKMDLENAKGNEECIQIAREAGKVIKEAEKSFMKKVVLDKNKSKIKES